MARKSSPTTTSSTDPAVIPAPVVDPADACPWQVGTAYFIRTVTYHVTGRLVWVGPTELVLDDAAWVADSGRWNAALTTGKLAEVEPFPGKVIVNRSSVVDACEWTHPLPRTVS